MGRFLLKGVLYQKLNKLVMTSPKKGLDIQKECTLFGDLSHLEKQATRLSKQLLEDVQTIKKTQGEFAIVQKEAKGAAQDFKVRAAGEISAFEQRIKGHLVAQKAEYARFANQINQIVSSHKDINSQLQLLSSRFQEYKRDVGI